MNGNSIYQKKYIEPIILVLITLLVEIFVFNIRSFQTAAYMEKTIDNSYEVELIGGQFNADGDIVMNEDAEYVVLNILGFGYPLNDIRLDVECLDTGICIAECSTFDDAQFECIDEDGRSFFVNGAVTSVQAPIIHDVEESHYIYLEPFGNTHRLQIVLYPETRIAQKLRIHDLSFNVVKPLKFHPVRMAAIFLFLMALDYLVINTFFWKEDCVTPKRWKKVLCFGVFASFSVFASVWMFLGVSPYSEQSDVLSGLLLRLATVALVGRLIWLIIEKYYRNTPIAMYLLMWWGTVCGMYIPALMTEMVMFYDIPILSGLVLTLAGTCFLVDASAHRGKKIMPKIFGGSICMAAVLLCCPAMLLYGLIIMLFLAWNHRTKIMTMACKDLVGCILSVAMPYVFFAILCMVYNVSPFDFGTSYNTADYAIEGGAPFLPYVIARSVYEYLLKPPFVDFSFPFTAFTGWEKVRDAGNLMVLFVVKGGILAANPFTWSLTVIGHYKDKLKQKRIFYLVLVCLASSMAVMVLETFYTASIYTWYTLKFSPVLLICACIVLMEIYGEAAGINDTRIWNGLRIVIAAMLMVSIVWGFMQLCCAGTDSAGLTRGNSELWYRMKYALRIF